MNQSTYSLFFFHQQALVIAVEILFSSNRWQIKKDCNEKHDLFLQGTPEN